MSNDGFTDFSFGTGDSNIGKKTKRFKGKEGETYRVSFVWTGEDGEGNDVCRFTGCERHYVQGVGYFLHKGPEYARVAGGPPKQAVATILIVWPTDKQGRLDKEKFGKGEGWEVKPWVFSAERYDQLRRRNEQFPLHEFDLTMACTDSQYQKMDLSPCRESLFTKLAAGGNDKAKAIVEAILAEVADAEKGIRNDMARDLSLDKIREKMGGAAASPASSGGGAAENVDGLLDNLLDD
jgi:hypothetical protein